MLFFDTFQGTSLQQLQQHYHFTKPVTDTDQSGLHIPSMQNDSAVHLSQHGHPIVNSIEIYIKYELTATNTNTSNQPALWIYGVPFYNNLLPLSTTQLGTYNAHSLLNSIIIGEPVVLTLRVHYYQINHEWYLSIEQDGLSIVSAQKEEPNVSYLHDGFGYLYKDIDVGNVTIQELLVRVNEEGRISLPTVEYVTVPVTTQPKEEIGPTLPTDIQNDTSLEDYVTRTFIQHESSQPVLVSGVAKANTNVFYAIAEGQPKYLKADQPMYNQILDRQDDVVHMDAARPLVLKFRNDATGVRIRISPNTKDYETNEKIASEGVVVETLDLEDYDILQDGQDLTSYINNGLLVLYPVQDSYVIDSLAIKDPNKDLIEVVDFGTLAAHYSFKGSGLTTVPTHLPVTVNSLKEIVRSTSLTSLSRMSEWDTRRVTDFSYALAELNTSHLPNWEYSSALTMEGMLYNTTLTGMQEIDINANIENLNMSNFAKQLLAEELTLTVNVPGAADLTSAFESCQLAKLTMNAGNAHDMTRMFASSSINECSFTSTEYLRLTNVTGFAQDSAVFNANLTNWCVPNVTITTDYDAGATAWLSQNKPTWGTCPDTE